MKKFFYSLIVIGGFACYAIYQNGLAASPSALVGTSPVPVAIVQPSVSPTLATPLLVPTLTPTAAPVPSRVPTPTRTPTPIPTSVPTPTPPPKPKGLYTDGTYTGSVADAYFGSVQVQVAISGGKITNVTFLQYPNDNGHSRAVSAQAVPQLKAEAIAAQSANVDVVSGATDTSQAFKQSLASALSQAKA